MKNRYKFEDILNFIFPKLGEILFLAFFAALIGFGPQMMNIDGDLGRHITLGNYIITSRTIPTEDIFSFTKLGDPLTPHEWLADVLFALFNQIGGLDGVVWFTAIILASAYWMTYKHSLNQSNMPILALVGAFFAAAASSLHWLSRPHIFTILLTVIWVAELEKLRVGIKRNWIIFPLIMLIWVNLHGAFIAGIVIWVIYLAGAVFEKDTASEVNPILWSGISSIVITIINPDGLGIWKTSFGFLGNQYLVSHTAEYLPPDFQQPSTWPFLLIIIISILVLAGGRKKSSPTHMLMIGGWTAMALYSARNIPLYAVSVMPILIYEFSDIVRDHQDLPFFGKLINLQDRILDIEQRLYGWVWIPAAVLITGLLLLKGYDLDFQKRGNLFLKEEFPVGAVDWMQEDYPEGNGFNYFPWGGYLLYRNWPDKLVFIDGQTDFYGEELTREYERVITLDDGWKEVLDYYDIRWTLTPSKSPIADALEKDLGWDVAYQDNTSILLIRK